MKSHRGISAIVGTVFLIVVVVGALSYVTSSLDTMANFSEQLVAEESRQKNIEDEKFDLINVNIVSNKLDATIKNTGDIPIKITTMYLDEMDNQNDIVQKININTTLAAGTSFDFLSESIDVDVDSTKGYSMKLISERGETQTFYLNSASQEPLDIRLVASPDRIPTGFTTTLMMIVVNNMSNNNPLVNLTPVEPNCTGICTKLSGPIPSSYDSLDPGEVAIFRWTYELIGDDTDSVTFTGELENGYAGNTDSETVTIKTIEISELAGQAIESLGFGQTELSGDIFVLHVETYGIPDTADYQLTTTVPETTGITHTFPTDGNSLQWFSANVTTEDTTIPAGNWNASLRYNHDRLPSELDIADIGMKLHFEDTSTSTELYDSGNDPDCYGFAESGNSGVSGATWYPDRGVNGSAAYGFDGDDDITIQIDPSETGGCTNFHKADYSVSGWFNATIDDDYDTAQFLFTLGDTNEEGGFIVKLGHDTSSKERGRVIFTSIGKDGTSGDCKSDRPDGEGGRNYVDNQWHHFVATMSGTTCNLYVDGYFQSSGGAAAADWHLDELTEDYHIGIDSSAAQGFTGYIDDIMFWYDLEMTQTQVTALKNFSFGDDSTFLNFYLNNATGVGTTLDVLAADTNVGVPWTDQGHYTTEDTLWRGGNWTKTLPQIGFKTAEPLNRLNFTISYASGEPINLRIDDEILDGPESDQISSYLQVPGVDPELPVYYTHDKDNKVTFFAYNGVNAEGVWFTYQGTRIVFNGTNGHYTGIVNSVDNGVDKSILSAQPYPDSPFIDTDQEADILFWHPQNVPKASQPGGPSEKIIPGTYDVTIYLNGYDEDGTVFIRSIAIGSVLVVD